MNCNKNKGFMIDYVSGALSGEDKDKLITHIKTCRECMKEFAELQTVNQATLDYFKQTIVPYDNEMEERFAEHLINEPASILTFIKKLYYQFKSILRPIAATLSIALLLIIGINSYTIYQKNMVITKISSIIDIKEETLNFVVLNNIDYVVQLSIRENNKFQDKEDLNAGIKYSLLIYLSSRLNNDYLDKNWDIIDNTLDRYTEDYYNFIRENHNNLLI